LLHWRVRSESRVPPSVVAVNRAIPFEVLLGALNPRSR
jgi:hypothetical protein